MRQICDACKCTCQPIFITDLEGKTVASVCNDCKLVLMEAVQSAFQSIQDAHP